MKWLAIIALMGLAACGADGEPMRPTGAVEMSAGSHGIATNTRIGATNGRVSMGIGLGSGRR